MVMIVKRWLILMLGFCLWIPSVAISVGGMWGIQFVLIFALIFLFVLSLKGGMKKEIHALIFIILFIILLLSSSLIGILPFSRGILSVLSESTLLIVSFAVYVCVAHDPNSRNNFVSGFYVGALISAGLACIQFIGLNLGVNFFAWELLNPSFIALGKETFEFHQRSYVFTPEPSILSGLLLAAIAMQVVRLRTQGSHVNWAILGLFMIAIITTASQGIIFVPFAIGSGIWLTKPAVNSSRWRNRFYIIFFTLAVLLLFLTIESLRRNFTLRIIEIFSDSAGESSYGSRSETIRAALRMYADYPILGAGPGSFTEALEKYALTNDQLGAANALVRYIAELGLITLFVWCSAFWMLLSVGYRTRHTANMVHGQLIAMALWFAIAAATFIGYRVLYQNTMWIGIAFALFQLNKSKRCGLIRKTT
jgi:O-antigen ligase